MSFASEVKTELTKIRIKPEDVKKAQLMGLTRSCGSLCIGRGGRSVIYKSECIPVSRHIAALATSLYPLDTLMELQTLAHRKNPLSALTLSGEGVDALLADAGVLPGLTASQHSAALPARRLLQNEECARALLRGAFLGSGSVNDPKRGYHLEIVTRTESFTELILSALAAFSLEGRNSQRKDRELVYLKGDDVSALLALMGSNYGALAFENTRTEKDYRNYLNRTNNCESANMDKTISAAVLQKNAILLIEDKKGLKTLPEPLYEAAMLRLRNPNASLAKLAELAEIGKSGMNHRLTRLLRIAEELES